MTHLLPSFSRALLRCPGPNFAAGITAATHLGAPDYERALKSALRSVEAGIRVEAAAKYCQRVITLDMSEFVKMDGGLTCLSLRY